MDCRKQFILSDERSYESFLCGICFDLITMDALVTSTCSHVFCKQCFDSWLEGKRKNLCCPLCLTSIELTRSIHENIEAYEVFDQQVRVQYLWDSQPLAYRVLSRLLVRCALQVHCGWTGNYCDLSTHLRECHPHASSNANYVPEGDNKPQFDSLGKPLPRGSLKTITSLISVGSDDSMLHSQGTCGDNDFHESDTVKEIDLGGAAEPSLSRRYGLFEEPNERIDCKRSKSYSDERRQKASEIKSLANSAYRAGKFQQACELYTSVLTMLCDDAKPKASYRFVATLFSNRAATWNRMKNFESCVCDCDAALRLVPVYIKPLLRKAGALVDLGRFEEAVTCLSQRIQRGQEKVSPEVLSELERVADIAERNKSAKKMLQQKSYAQAKVFVSPILEKMENGSILVLAARADFGLGETGLAIDLAERAMKVNPRLSEALELIGEILLASGDFEKAIEKYREAIRTDPLHAGANGGMRTARKVRGLLSKARLASENKNFVLAKEVYTLALDEIQHLPSSSDLFYVIYAHRGKVNYCLEDHEAALEDTAIALQIHADDLGVWKTRIQALEALECHERMIRELQSRANSIIWKYDFVQSAFGKADMKVKQGKRLDYYALFGLSKASTTEEIKKAHTKKLEQLQQTSVASEIDGTSSSKETEEVSLQSKLLDEGLAILTDPFQRSLYDQGFGPQQIQENAGEMKAKADERRLKLTKNQKGSFRYAARGA